MTNWEDQRRLFTEAAAFTGKVDYVIANAGICAPDEVFTFAGKKNIIYTANTELNKMYRQGPGAHRTKSENS